MNDAEIRAVKTLMNANECCDSSGVEQALKQLFVVNRVQDKNRSGGSVAGCGVDPRSGGSRSRTVVAQPSVVRRRGEVEVVKSH